MGPHNRDKGRVCTKSGKIYPLLREERREVCEFINEQLRKRCIRPSKLPQMAPVFFVGKKDSNVVATTRHNVQ